MADESLAALGEKYQSLRSRPGKYGGGEYDEQVDSPDGEKFKVMKVKHSVLDEIMVPVLTSVLIGSG